MTSSFTQFKNDMTQTSNLKTINTHLGDLKKNITPIFLMFFHLIDLNAISYPNLICMTT